MSNEEIIRMANDVGIKGPAPARQGFKMYASPDRLKRFAALVASAEREACAKVCETHAPTTTPTYVSYAAAIRARGQA